MSKKIFIVLPHLTVGGTERTAAVLSKYLAQAGDNVTVLVMYNKKKFYQLDPKVKLIEPPAHIRAKVGKLLYLPYAINFIRSEIKRGKPDVVFALGYIAFALIATLGLSCKVVISGRSSPSRIRFPGNPLLNGVYNLSHKLLRKRVDGIIAQTVVAERSYRKRYASPIKVIPNFLREIPQISTDRKNQIVTVGRCVREKGQHFLIEAFSKLKAPGWQLKIVGDGPKRGELEHQARTLNVSDSVVFTGFQEDVDNHLRESKIFALTSVIEGFPNALIEAMATPLAVVSFDCEAGPAEIINDNENGFLIPVGDVAVLSSRLQTLVDDPVLLERFTRQASVARKQYSIEIVGAQYRNFFYQISNSVNS